MIKAINNEKIGSVFSVILKVLYFLIVGLLILIFGTVAYFSNTWSDLSYSEIVFHLKTSIEGTNPDMIYSALLRYALPAVIAFVAVIVLFSKLKKKKQAIVPAVSGIILVVLVLMNVVILYRFNSNTNVLSDFWYSMRRDPDSDFVKDNYVDPSTVSINFPDKKRNLIYIYMESMEATFSDKSNGGAYADNYIPELTKLSEEYDNFSGDENKLNGGIVLPGTQWTSGALFGQTSGLPLELPVDQSTADTAEEFFPQLVAMGDILEKAGYTNVLEMGSSASFGGMKAYYEKHGNYSIRDYDYALKEGLIPKDYYVFWGYEDEKLFDFAKKDLTELAKEDKPFNYTMFTMDTHFEDGYVCRLCEDKYGDNQYANVIACSDKQVSDFIKWIQQQDFYDNTTIVVTGDHTTMDSDFCENVSDKYQRKTYTSIINSAVEPQINEHRDYATIDLFPTILASLGVEMSSERLGCGTNLYGTEKTIIEQYGKDVCKAEFSRGSAFVESLANVKVTEKNMEAAKKSSYIEVADEFGNIRFRLVRADDINYLNISKLQLVVKDKKTGEKYDYEMEYHRIRAGWDGVVHSDISFDRVDNLECEVYVTVDDFDNYLLKSVTSEEFTQWNIKWDVD